MNNVLKKKSEGSQQENDQNVQYIQIKERSKIKLLKNQNTPKVQTEDQSKQIEVTPAPDLTNKQTPIKLFEDDRVKIKPKLIEKQEFYQNGSKVPDQKVEKKPQQKKKQAPKPKFEQKAKQNTKKYQYKLDKDQFDIITKYEDSAFPDRPNYINIGQKSEKFYVDEAKHLFKKHDLICLRGVGENVCKAIIIVERISTFYRGLKRVNIPGTVNGRLIYKPKAKRADLKQFEEPKISASITIQLSLGYIDYKHFGYQQSVDPKSQDQRNSKDRRDTKDQRDTKDRRDPKDLKESHSKPQKYKQKQFDEREYR